MELDTIDPLSGAHAQAVEQLILRSAEPFEPR